ncbi:MAG: F420-dependent methylenetetrahydromethanopterin dehydrogenase [Candidatus Hydrothermarchaeales archaeon]
MKIGVAKTGNIASSLLLELLLDERADRAELEVRVVGSGAKMTPEACRGVLQEILRERYDLILYSTPNPGAPGPQEIIQGLKGKRAVIIGDAPGLKIKDKLEEKGFGYVFVTGDAMIGARREFLDPIEMSIFNGDMLKVLAVTGALRALHEAVDQAIGSKSLPHLVIDASVALAHSGIKNPYALAKARAAYEMAEKVGELNAKACFSLKKPEEYIPLVAAAHEMLRNAAQLADQAREIEKSLDQVTRRPHSSSGDLLEKDKLMEKPK